jgi:hypothetical protein
MQRLLAITATALTLTLSGCATLSESQCLANDWQTVGYRDGISGTQSSQLLKHQNACVKHGVVPDRTAYLGGWEQGVEQYCQPDNGFNAGERGAGYSNVCPAHLKDSFYEAYQDGRKLYLAHSEINNLSRSISQKEYRLKQLNAQISSTEARLVDDATPAIQRRELLETTKDLAREQGQLEAEMQDLAVDVALKTERLQQLRQTLAYAGYE